jgi:hypothetical protein
VSAPVCSITQLADAITNLLGGTCKLFTTPCISHELKSMGPDTAAAAAAARRHQLHKCEHDPCKLPAECLLEQVGAAPGISNKKVFAIACRQDAFNGACTVGVCIAGQQMRMVHQRQQQQQWAGWLSSSGSGMCHSVSITAAASMACSC